MTLLHIKVEGKTATYLRRDGAIVCGNDDYRIIFTYDSEWAEHTNKKARFLWGGQYFDVDVPDDPNMLVSPEVAVPVIDDAKEVIVGLYVENMEGETLLRTTTSARIPCVPSVLSRKAKAHPDHGRKYADEALQAAGEARAATEAAQKESSSAALSAGSAAASASTAGACAERAETAASAAVADADRAEQAAGRAGTSEASAHLAREGAEAAAASVKLEVDSLRKRVVNLEQGITPDPYHEDNAVAVAKTVPANALPYAQIDAVGGMTYRVHTGTSIAFDYAGNAGDAGANSQKVVINATDKTVAVTFGPESTSAAFSAFFPGAVVGKTYTLTFKSSVVGYALPSGCTLQPSGTFMLTQDIYNAPLVFNALSADGAGVKGIFSEIVLTEVAAELHDTKVTAIVSHGISLLPHPYPSIPTEGLPAGITVTPQEDGSLIFNGYASRNISLSLYREYDNLYLPPEPIYIDPIAKNGLTLFVRTGSSGAVWRKGSFTPSVNDEYFGRYYVYIYIEEGSRFDNLRVCPSITLGSKKREGVLWEPPVRFEIPEEVQALDGYGWGIPGGAYNGVEWDENGKATFVKRVGRRTFDGTERELFIGGLEGQVSMSLIDDTLATGAAAICCNKYPAGRPEEVGFPCAYADIIYVNDVRTARHIFYPGSTTMTATEWRAQLAEWAAAGDPLTVYYELAEPVVTDISRLVSTDNFIGVEPGGLIIMQNERGDAVPSTVVYQLKPTEA